MLAEKSDLLKVIFLKIKNNLLISQFSDIQLDRIANLCLSFLDYLISFLLLSKLFFRILDMLLVYFKSCSQF